VSLSVLLSRKNINIQSGAGQMIVSQARCLDDLGYNVSVCCAKFGRGAVAELQGISHRSLPRPLRLLLTSRMRERAYQARTADIRRLSNGILIDHGQTFADADIAYVHNFPAPKSRERIPSYLANEQFPWSAAAKHTTLIANSRMVQQALIETYEIPESKVIVQYPGYDAHRFNLDLRNRHRTATRYELGVGQNESLIGLVTSGNFEKRALDLFLDCFSHLRGRHENLRGLVIGGRHVPRLLATDRAYQAGHIIYRHVTSEPERYVAALDLVLYPARYEEFGIVVLEAMAMGVPIVTSTAVGSAELLAQVSDRLVIEAGLDDLSMYCERANNMLRLAESEKAELEASLCGIAENHTHEVHNSGLMTIVHRIQDRTSA
jgi:UDP-glucose:(heptosyl)LPS alpha-1,3-glucosyltransferase